MRGISKGIRLWETLAVDNSDKTKRRSYTFKITKRPIDREKYRVTPQKECPQV
ncbi:Hypothetical protein FKW44_005218 [Caligus rogercresseyi]|uniref:Uncharacterized protein n=1 Tax=Caligus rogercresseyi TaxID=217165 RepID=A0A7T8KBN4_CALRO|nr:Hypothetical protein FKW44_005218 [Caligus rogercresseyi]